VKGIIMIIKSRYSPRKTEKLENADGLQITVNSYCIGPFGEYCAVTVDKGKNFLGSRIVPLIWVQRKEEKA